MNIINILDDFIKSINNEFLLSSIARSSLVLIFGIISLLVLYLIVPLKFDKIKTEYLNSLSNVENTPLILGIIGFYMLGTTGFAYLFSRLIKIYYSTLISVWISISFVLITTVCILFYKNIKFGLVPVIIGWIGAGGGIFSIFLEDSQSILSLIIEIIILSFLISVGVWFLNVKASKFIKKFIFSFGILLIFYGSIKLVYFLCYISQIPAGFLEFLYIISPTFLDIITILGPITISFTKCMDNNN